MGCFSLLARAWFFGLILLFLCLGKGCGCGKKAAPPPPPPKPSFEWKFWLIFIVGSPVLLAFAG